MLEVVSGIIVYFITHIIDCWVFSKLICEKFKFKLKLIALITTFTIIDYFTGNISDELTKIIITNLTTFILLKIIYNKSVSKTLVATILMCLGCFISEVLFATVFLNFLSMSENFFLKNPLGIIFTNIIILTFYLTLFNITTIRKLLIKIINWYSEKENLNLIISSFVAILIFYIFVFQFSHNKINNLNNLLVLIIIVLAIVIFIVGYFNEKSSNNKLTIEYGQLLEYVKDYEKEVVEKGKKQHEYKNQLVVINDMIPKTNKKLKKYVEDKLEIEEKINDNIWLEKLTNLPSGGIKGLVYYKIKKMIENKICIYIEVDNTLSSKKKWFNVDEYLEDYTRILGVYLDNAIEAAIESNDKQIIIEFKDNKEYIEFILSNTYNGEINHENIGKEKYTTKGKGRGYGLSLVKDIIDKNKLLNQSREINGKFYVQKLTIKK